MVDGVQIPVDEAFSEACRLLGEAAIKISLQGQVIQSLLQEKQQKQEKDDGYAN